MFGYSFENMVTVLKTVFYSKKQGEQVWFFFSLFSKIQNT